MGILATTIPPYWGWTSYTPVIPKLYWDVYSQEERIKRLCMEYDKLTHYASTIADGVNDISGEVDGVVDEVREQLAAQDKKIEEQLAAQNQKVQDLIDEQNGIIEDKFAEMQKYFDEQFEQQQQALNKSLEELKEYVDKRFAEYEETIAVYDVTTGTYRPSEQTMRRLFQALSYGFKGDKQLVQDVALDTVEAVAMKTVYNLAYTNQETIIIDDQVPNN